MPSVNTITATEHGTWSSVRTFDGTPIVWRRDGPGADGPRETEAAEPLTLVLCNGIACSDGYWTRVLPQLTAHHEVVRWDYRGHGRSGSPVDAQALGVDAVVRDLHAVLEAAAVSRGVLVGHSFGVQVALEAVRSDPTRVAGVVAVAGAPGRPLPGMLGLGGGALVLSPLAALNAAAPALTRRLWRGAWSSDLAHGVARGLRATTSQAPRRVMADYFGHVAERDLELLVGMLRGMQVHDAAEVVGALPVPLLCVAGSADGFTPMPGMAAMARRAPDGELAVVPAASHTLPAEQPEVLLGLLEGFMERLRAGGAP